MKGLVLNLSAAAAGVAVAAAAAYPAQGAAAPHRHHLEPARVRLAHHTLRVARQAHSKGQVHR
ncbi:MAG TPA: hypothetical protein VGP69_17670 [Gaiellaceae bacterium]|jgi:hypothetical protein|nr:hypothetical protein [Gaiellaceae bacterium]